VKPPATAAVFAQASWADILPYYEALAAAPLKPATLTAWLRDWSQLEAALSEAAALAMIAYTCDTGDPGKEAVHLRFSVEIVPKAEEQSVGLARRLVAQPEVPEGMETTVARFKAPRAVLLCDRIGRHASGKADYRWAREAALDAVPATSEA